MNNYSEVRQKLLSFDDYVILTHKKPDGDTLGSARAICEFLRNNNKKAIIWTKEDIPKNLSFLSGEHFTKKKPTNKIKTVLSVDCAEKFMIEERLNELDYDVFINIDHHKTNTHYADYNYVEIISSNCEYIYNILEPTDLNQVIMESLYAGIATDTFRFFYSGVTSDSLRKVAYMMDKGLNISKLNFKIFGQNSFKKLKLSSKALDNAKFYLNKEIVTSIITRKDQEKISCDNTEDIVEMLRDIEGVKLSILAYHYKEETKISLRSVGDIDTSKIAKHFGGGGHFGASGINFKDKDIFKSLERLLDYIIKNVWSN